MNDDEDTPVAKPRRQSTTLTAWHLVSTWLNGDRVNRKIEIVTTPASDLVVVVHNANRSATEPVSPLEDPSAACVRGIGRVGA